MPPAKKNKRSHFLSPPQPSEAEKALVQKVVNAFAVAGTDGIRLERGHLADLAAMIFLYEDDEAVPEDQKGCPTLATFRASKGTPSGRPLDRWLYNQCTWFKQSSALLETPVVWAGDGRPVRPDEKDHGLAYMKSHSWRRADEAGNLKMLSQSVHFPAIKSWLDKEDYWDGVLPPFWMSGAVVDGDDDGDDTAGEAATPQVLPVPFHSFFNERLGLQRICVHNVGEADELVLKDMGSHSKVQLGVLKKSAPQARMDKLAEEGWIQSKGTVQAVHQKLEDVQDQESQLIDMESLRYQSVITLDAPLRSNFFRLWKENPEQFIERSGDWAQIILNIQVEKTRAPAAGGASTRSMGGGGGFSSAAEDE